MTNRQVARVFNKLAKVMELHQENPFKIKSYATAYNTIRRLSDEVMELERGELLAIRGIGKNIADKVEELKDTGKLNTLQRYLEKTPPGIVDLLDIKGFGAKKILTVWNELGIESPGELLYACEENRLVDLKGFGEKTQANLKKQLVYFLDAQGKYLYGHVIEEAQELLDRLTSHFVHHQFDFINDIRRQNPIIEQINIIGTEEGALVEEWLKGLPEVAVEDDVIAYQGTIVQYDAVDDSEFYSVLFESSASDDFLSAWYELVGEDYITEPDESLFDELDMEFIPPECRESGVAVERAKAYTLDLISTDDIKGVIHAHSTYSDGVNTLEQMCAAVKERGFEYFVISDHSQSAFYANGLKPDRVLTQMREIDRLNEQYDSFKIFKSIESDILYDGQLDYSEELLSKFDLVIASVHAHLKMDIVKATDRVIAAVHNRYTRILGHPTGRLLLSREGYPLDHKAVIDACAQSNVAIELNANPYRLDLDWTWISYAVEQGVKISINPDAHSIKGIDDIKYGVSAARKGLLTPSDCLNSMNLEEFTGWLNNK